MTAYIHSHPMWPHLEYRTADLAAAARRLNAFTTSHFDSRLLAGGAEGYRPADRTPELKTAVFTTLASSEHRSSAARTGATHPSRTEHAVGMPREHDYRMPLQQLEHESRVPPEDQSKWSSRLRCLCLILAVRSLTGTGSLPEGKCRSRTARAAASPGRLLGCSPSIRSRGLWPCGLLPLDRSQCPSGSQPRRSGKAATSSTDPPGWGSAAMG